MIIRPKGPKPQVLFGSFLHYKKNPLDFFTSLASPEFNDIAYFKMGPIHCYFLNNPEYIKDVFMTHYKNFIKGRGLQVAKKLLGEGLLTSEGDFHRRQRRLAQPAFHHQRLVEYSKSMIMYSHQHISRWKNEQVIDMNSEMMALTLNIVAKTLFNSNVEKDIQSITSAFTEAFAVFNKIITRPRFLEHLPLPTTLRLNRAKKRIDKIIYKIISERRKSGDTGDLLSMLLSATDIESDGSSMNDRQLRDEVMTFFLAGHETTANVLSWMWYELARNPEVEKKLHQEIDEVLKGRSPTFEDVKKLPYCRMVFHETLRLYPPVWLNGRVPIADYKIGDYTIPKGSLVFVSAYVMQRDSRFFKNPKQFQPERWLPGEEAKRPKFSFFAFGGGPRTCAGEAFAWMEAILIIAIFASRWKMVLVNQDVIEPEVNFTMRPKLGVKMVLHERKI